MSKKKILSVILIILVFIAGFLLGKVINFGNQEEESSSSTQIVEVTVGTETIENTLSSSGAIASSDSETLSLSTSKYFKMMCVETNDIVLEGENILEYSNGTYLTADYDCIVVGYSVPTSGSICTSSNYVQVENIENMTMSLSISENDISKVEKGQEVTIEVTAIEDKTYTGTIKSVSDAGTYSSSGTTFDAVVEFENDGNIKPGMSASCEITLEKAEDCVAIPITAVQTKDNQKYVVVVNSNGETENVNIETGISNDSYVQIISGLSGGETIQSVETVTNNSKGNNQGGSFGGGQMGGGDMPSDMGGGQMPSGDMPGGGGGKQDFNK